MSHERETESLINQSPPTTHSSSTVDDSSEIWLIRAASRAMSDGIMGKKPRAPLSRTPRALRAHIWRLKLNLVTWSASILLIILSFFEPPYWCGTSERCTHHWKVYPQMHISYVGGGAATAYALICLFPLAVDEYLRIRSNGKSGTSTKSLVVPFLILLSATFVVMNLLLPPELYRALRLRPIDQGIRVCFLVMHDYELFSQLSLMIKLIPRFLKFLTLLLFVGALFSLFGMSLFPERTSMEGQKFFNSLDDSLWNFLLLLTSNNTPFIIISALQMSQASTLFIIFFIIISYFYFLNLVLAIVYDGYLHQKKEFVTTTKLNYAANLEIAFTMLTQCKSSPPNPLNMKKNKKTKQTTSSTGEEKMTTFERQYQSESDFVDNGRVKLLLEELDKLHCIGSVFAWLKIRTNQHSMANRFLEEEGDDSLKMDRIQFAQVAQLIMLESSPGRGNKQPLKPNPMRRHFPSLYRNKGFQLLTKIVRSACFQYTFAALLVLNMVTLFLETQGQPLYDITVPITIGFVAIFGLEFLLLLLVNGWHWIMKSNRRRMEVVALFLTITLIPMVLFMKWDSDENANGRLRILRMILVLRCTPTIRLLSYVGDYKIFAKVTFAIIPRGFEMMKVMFTVMYLFCLVGMQAFAGLICFKCPALQDTPYLEEGLESLNFNDMPSGMLTLIQVLMVNDFDSIVSGFVAVTSKWARVYFTAFFLLGVLLILNIVIAVTLDSYLTSMRETEHAERLKLKQKKYTDIHHHENFKDIDDDDHDIDDDDDDEKHIISCFALCAYCVKKSKEKKMSITSRNCCMQCNDLFKFSKTYHEYTPLRNNNEEDDDNDSHGDQDDNNQDGNYSDDDDGGGESDDEITPGLKRVAVSKMMRAISSANESVALSLQERSTLLSEALLTNTSSSSNLLLNEKEASGLGGGGGGSQPVALSQNQPLPQEASQSEPVISMDGDSEDDTEYTRII